jgi:uncharacterized protein YkwD
LSRRADGCYGQVMPAATPRPRRRVRIAALGLALSVAGAGLYTSEAAAAERATGATSATIRLVPEATTQQNVFIYTNAHRARYGAQPVRYNYALSVAAQRHANDMANRNQLTHVGSDGSNAGQRIIRAGFRWTSWAENIAVGYTSSSAVVWAWLNSPGHRANLLNPRFKWMGVGIAWGHGRMWWCVVLAS